MNIYISILLIVTVIQVSHPANILALFAPPFKSHYFWSSPLLDALESQGHHLTVLSPFPVKNPGPNRHDILLEDIFNSSEEIFNYPSLIKSNTIQSLLCTFNFINSVETVVKMSMSSNATKVLINSTEVFDLIIVDMTFGECILGFVHKFNYPPVISIVPYGVDPYVNDLLGNPEIPSYIPHSISPVSDVMSFYERLLNMIVHLNSKVYYRVFHLPLMNRLAKEYFGEDLPSVEDIGRHIDIVFVNTHDSVDYPRPFVPSMIPVGGMHTKPAKPLPKGLRKFLDEATQGAIFFSLGTNVRSDQLGAYKVNQIINAFKQLPQRVVWKFESDVLPELPANVRVEKWLPQNDILGHPKVRLFIGHAGLLSLHEAVYHGVPILAIPFFGDQHHHAEKIVARGIGEKLNFMALNTETFLEPIKTILDNSRYRENAKRLSRLYSDQPQSPLDRALYWTEYLLRHKGAQHLRVTGADMPWYRYWSLDTIAMLVLVLGLLVLTSYVICRTAFTTIGSVILVLERYKLKLD